MRRPAALFAVAVLLVACSEPTDPDIRARPPGPTDQATPPSAPSAPSAPSPSPSPPGATPTQAPSPSASPSPDPGALRVRLETAGDGFESPVHTFVHDGRTLVVEQAGRVRDLQTAEVWLDIADRVRAGGEQGLLAVDVHPDGGHVVAHWTGRGGATTLTTYQLADGTPDVGSEQVVLRVAQPAANHNGGTAVFGPDGRFWLALGDGGAAGDRFDNAQDRSTLLGALLRLDLDDPDEARVPSDNPFVDDPDAAAEVWAYGLRNPYRVSFTPDQVYVTDVGQDAVEEVTVLTYDQAGANLGWPLLEGDRCYREGCDPTAFEPADVTYTHGSTAGCSVIGGLVYGGAALPALGGHFLYGDRCGGILRTVRAEDGEVVDEHDLTAQVGSVAGITGIGADADGEPLLTFSDGRVLRLVPS